MGSGSADVTHSICLHEFNQANFERNSTTPESQWHNSHVLVDHGPLPIATFCEFGPSTFTNDSHHSRQFPCLKVKESSLPTTNFSGGYVSFRKCRSIFLLGKNNDCQIDTIDSWPELDIFTNDSQKWYLYQEIHAQTRVPVFRKISTAPSGCYTWPWMKRVVHLTS